MVVHEISTQAEMNDYLSSNPLVLVHFTSKYSDESVRCEPVLSAWSKKVQYKEIKFVKCDCSKKTDRFEKYLIKTIPTFLFFTNGQKTAVVLDVQLNLLQQTIDEQLNCKLLVWLFSLDELI
ncbi:unnamed protein product [Didymodactylos carnosus]|uniref:Thioredoxin domain-containing protein n=1 Tax=Didymodactylos carnosus TaxID=1234261 RepID=A0A816D1N8_9BILA|nr:unnamed protein product [Didymodactylos carnosus]CAF1628892.1 unnamed protein product [Didymodactylos carnosus]CAF4363015.1 unnamed protein product [Didymodactylos carnosus]CAF4525981.1 unnamed protein product [Didymodactylos carnosus]